MNKVLKSLKIITNIKILFKHLDSSRSIKKMDYRHMQKSENLLKVELIVFQWAQLLHSKTHNLKPII